MTEEILLESIFSDKTIYDARPTDCSVVESTCYDALEKANIPFLRVSHRSIATIGECDEVREVLGVSICKNLFLTNSQKTDFYLVIMPGEKPFKTKLLSPQLDCSRLSFAPSELMEKYIGCTPGSASILGLLFDTELSVRLVIDKELLQEEFFGCHPCDNTSSLKIKTEDVIERLIPLTCHTPTFVNL